MGQFFSEKSKILSDMQKRLHRCRTWVKQIEKEKYMRINILTEGQRSVKVSLREDTNAE